MIGKMRNNQETDHQDQTNFEEDLTTIHGKDEVIVNIKKSR